MPPEIGTDMLEETIKTFSGGTDLKDFNSNVHTSNTTAQARAFKLLEESKVQDSDKIEQEAAVYESSRDCWHDERGRRLGISGQGYVEKANASADAPT